MDIEHSDATMMLAYEEWVNNGCGFDSVHVSGVGLSAVFISWREIKVWANSKDLPHTNKIPIKGLV